MQSRELSADHLRTLSSVAGVILLLLEFWLSSTLGAAAPTNLTGKGVVVEKVAAGSALEQAGIHPGDVLVAWQRLPVSAASSTGSEVIRSVFDWMWVEVEEAPKGALRIYGRQAGVSRSFELKPGRRGAEVRPRLSTAENELFGDGLQAIRNGNVREGANELLAALDSQKGTDASSLNSWLFLHIGKSLAAVGDLEAARENFDNALKEAQGIRVEALLWDCIGEAYEKSGLLEESGQASRSAVRIRQSAGFGRLGLARSFFRMAKLAIHRSADKPDAELAVRLYTDALTVQKELAPGSFATAATLNNLGNLLRTQRRLDLSSEYLRQSLDIFRGLRADEVRQALFNAGLTASEQGLLNEARSFFERALDEYQEQDVKGPSIGNILRVIGEIHARQGDYEVAEEHFDQALEFLREVGPRSPTMMNTLVSYGFMLSLWGDHVKAKPYFEEALKLHQSLALGNLWHGDILQNIGDVYWNLGELETAETHFRQAMSTREPGTLSYSRSLMALALVEHQRRNLDQASQLLKEAIEIRQQLAPRSDELAVCYRRLAVLNQEQGDLTGAEKLLERSLDIQNSNAPYSMSRVFTLNRLGLLYAEMQRTDLALEFLARAVHSLEEHTLRLGATERVRTSYQSEYRDFYLDYIGSLLSTGKNSEALAVLERSRARRFLVMLQERESLSSLDVPEELVRARQRAIARFEKALEVLARLDESRDAQKFEKFQEDLGARQHEYDKIIERIRKASPKIVRLRDPETLKPEEIQDALDPGTIFLSFSVRKHQTDLFALSNHGQLRVEPIEVGEVELRREVDLFRRRIKAVQMPNSRHPALLESSKRLYRLLIGPVEHLVANSTRILIIPDGPLHLLPFAALIREASNDRGWQYLVEWKPIHSVLSATVYAELKKGRSEPSRSLPEITAFGDPYYPQRFAGGEVDSIGDVRVRSVASRGLFNFEPLPHTRREVEQIARLYGEAATTYLGSEATEERAKSTAPNTRILHFATHGTIDDRFPLNSALALSIPEQSNDDRDNGLLQAWEIFERVRIDADLVVLSACESGLGEEQGGEGLIGLTRAFQYAGARTVAASLWKVADQATTELMVRFYRHLRAGEPKDEALRAAQIELIREPVRMHNRRGEVVDRDLSLPYYWAAFQLFGDRR